MAGSLIGICATIYRANYPPTNRGHEKAASTLRAGGAILPLWERLGGIPIGREFRG
jgi:hypothetical protein